MAQKKRGKRGTGIEQEPLISEVLYGLPISSKCFSVRSTDKDKDKGK